MMSGIRGLLAGALIAAACGCSRKGSGRDYMPLAIGSQWDYRVTTAEGQSSFRRMLISGTASQGVFRAAEGNDKSLWAWDDGFLSVQRRGERIYMLALPAVRGTSWWTVTPDGKRVWCKVEGASRVKVPAGEFSRCVEVVMEPVGGKTEIRHWFARGVGWVRYSYGPRGGRPWMVRELVSFRLKPSEATPDKPQR